MSTQQIRFVLAVLLFSFLSSVPIVRAQGYRASIQGVVTDATQSVIPGAEVTLTNKSTSVATIKLTDTEGRYLFDFVEPGTYTVTVSLPGFKTFIQENILVQVRSDVTVNATMAIGEVQETVTVTTRPVAVQFNTTSLDLTMDNTMVNNLPIVARNPFTLALLNPAVVSRYTAQKNPFFMWSASTVEVGGTQNRTVDVLVDGMPVMQGPKSSYAPTMENTTEVTVQQNSVDAEYGHSSGGILNVSTKSGTNDLHGTAYYFGRNPKLNAVSNPLTETENLVRNHMWGGSAGFPWWKNRIFNFFAYEQWRQKDPRSVQHRMMTALEREGNFSQSRNIEGGLRTIYDPWTSRFDPVTKRATRQPFPNNIIPQSRMDPTALKFLGEMWGPNRAGQGFTGRDNFVAGFTRNLAYHNISNRIDFNVTEHVRTFFRFSRFRTDLEDPNWTPNQSRLFPNDNGGAMNALNVSGDLVWTINSSTVLNIRSNYTSNNDDYFAPEQFATLQTYKEFFSNATDFYTRYLDIGAPFYYPGIFIDGGSPGGTYGKSNWWFQHPQSYYDAVRISKEQGNHYLKAGFEFRTTRIDAIRPQTFRFRFRDDETADTWINPNTRLSGDAWANFLLGAISPQDSWARHVPFKKDTIHYYGVFIHDDWKIRRNVTLNLGLRYEYESAIFDRGGNFEESTFEPNRYSRGLDLNSPIPEFQGAGAPRMPAQAVALMDRPWIWNGAWMFTDEDHRGMWDPRKLILLPRAGVAVRLNDRTSLRVGFARFNTPSKLQRDDDVLGSTPVPGFGADTPIAPHVDGVPQQRLSDPFPAGVNPVVLPVGKGDGRYTQMGAVAEWDKRELVTGVNDRFNFTLQRETVAHFLVEATYFFNLGRDRPYILDLNQVNPEIINREGRALTRNVANPFFNLLPQNQMRGPLRNRRTVSLLTLLRPYPHYDAVRQLNTDGVRERYHSLQLRVQRPFANGFNFLMAYNYNQEKTEEYFNKEETFLNQFRWEDSRRPRHRMAVAGTYEFPFGKGRRFLSSAHPVLDAILGGWTASAIYWYYAGNRLRFGHMNAVGDPQIDEPDKWGFMFNPNALRFNPDAAFQARTNPKSYPGVQGPGYKNLDFNVAKFFRLTERIRLEFKLEAYNLFNTFSGADPSTDVRSASFGRVTRMAAGTQGRELQYNARIHF